MEDIRARWLQRRSGAANKRIDRSRLRSRFCTRLWPLVALGLVVAILASACGGERKICQADVATASGGGSSADRIAFISSRGSGSSFGPGDICLIDADGLGLTRLDGAGDASFFAWSPDGTSIAVERNDNSLKVLNLDGGGASQLTKDGVDGFAWSPGGDRIAFASQGDIYVTGANGDDEIQLGLDSAYDFSPSWSPDGFQIAFLSGAFGLFSLDDDIEGIEIYVTYVDDPSPSRVSNELNLTGRWGGAVLWSPDGSRLALATNSGYSFGAIYVIDVAGLRETLSGITGEGGLAWSPDGDRIAFASRGRSVWDQDIYVMDVESSDVSKLTEDHPGADASPAWSPDGSRIAFSREGDIWVMNADGSGETNITNSPDAVDRGPAWAPQ